MPNLTCATNTNPGPIAKPAMAEAWPYGRMVSVHKGDSKNSMGDTYTLPEVMIDHLVIISEETQLIKVNRGVLFEEDILWFLEDDAENILPRGRSLVCMCNLHKNPLLLYGSNRAHLKLVLPEACDPHNHNITLKVRKARSATPLKHVIGEDEEDTHGTLVVIKKHKEVSSLQFLCNQSLTQEDIIFAQKNNNEIWKDGAFLRGVKTELKFKLQRRLIPTCTCDRWADKLPTNQIVQEIADFKKKKEEEDNQ